MSGANPLLFEPGRTAPQRCWDAFATPRLVMRRPVAGDAETLFPAFSDAGVMRWWSRPPFGSVDELRAALLAPGNGSWRNWAISRAADGGVIGFVGATEDRHAGVSEISCLLDRDARGHGFAREAVGGLVDLLFAEGQRRVFADADPDNRRSCELLRSLGFRLEGRLRREWHTHLGVRDGLLYALLPSEWRRNG